MDYETVIYLNNQGKSMLQNNRVIFKDSVESYHGSMKLVDFLNRTLNYKIVLENSGFVIKDCVKNFSLVEKDYIIGFNISRLIDWFLNADFGVYLSNVSFLRDKMHLFKYFNMTTSAMNYIFECLDSQILDLLSIKLVSNKELSKMLLCGYDLVYKWQYSVYLFKKNNSFYIVSPYKLIVQQDAYFKFSKVKVKNIYMDIFDLSQRNMLRELFAFNDYLENVVAKDCNLCSDTNISGWFRNSKNLRTVEIVNLMGKEIKRLRYLPILFENNGNIEKIVLDKCLSPSYKLFKDSEYSKKLEKCITYV